MPTKKIMAIGDSITQGLTGNFPSVLRSNNTYTNVLSDMINRKKLNDKYVVYNFGVCGATALKVSNWPYT